MRPAVLLPCEGQFRALCPPIHWPRAAWGTVREVPATVCSQGSLGNVRLPGAQLLTSSLSTLDFAASSPPMSFNTLPSRRASPPSGLWSPAYATH